MPIKRISFDVAGDQLIGNLHLPSSKGVHPAVVTCGPMTSVKEQVTGTYAAELARQGIAALAFDHRHFGESAGEPRHYEFYKDKIADLKAAFHALSAQPEVASHQIGAVGICLGCGYMAHAIANRSDIRGFVSIAGYYRDVEAMKAADPIGFADKVAQGKKARMHYEATGCVETIPAAALDRDAAMTMQSTFEYYTKRAVHPNYENRFAVMSREYFLEFDVQSAAPHIRTPFLMAHGPNALNPSWADKFYKAVPEPKEQAVVTSEGQTDIYDNPEIVKATVSQAVEFLSRAL